MSFSLMPSPHIHTGPDVLNFNLPVGFGSAGDILVAPVADTSDITASSDANARLAKLAQHINTHLQAIIFSSHAVRSVIPAH